MSSDECLNRCKLGLYISYFPRYWISSQLQFVYQWNVSHLLYFLIYRIVSHKGIRESLSQWTFHSKYSCSHHCSSSNNNDSNRSRSMSLLYTTQSHLFYDMVANINLTNEKNNHCRKRKGERRLRVNMTRCNWISYCYVSMRMKIKRLTQWFHHRISKF